MIKTGIDISSRRMSKLEKEAVSFALTLPKNSVCLDLGAGCGFFSLVLTFLHQKVYLIDQKINWKIKLIKKIFALENLILLQKDISKMNYADFPDNISLVYSARFFHYLKYEEAEKLLKILKRKCGKSNSCKLFFSISGISSELGKSYAGQEKSIENRFDFLSMENQKKFHIKNKVTLYSQEDVQKIFSKYFDVQKAWQSDFGNIFVIAIMK